MHLITAVVLLQLFSSPVSSFSPNLGFRTVCSACALCRITLHSYRDILMFYVPFLSIICLLLLFHFWQLPLYCFYFQGSAHCCPSCICASCILVCDLDPDSYSCFTWIFLFLFFLPFYASTISEKAFFLQCSYPPWSLNFCQRVILQSPSKASALFFPLSSLPALSGNFLLCWK